MVEGEQTFIDEEWKAVQEDHSVIIGRPNMKGVAENLGVKLGECHLEDAL